jgi:hypothetical protein
MKIVNICDYGARVCDSLQTTAIQAAIDDCFLAGGGRVVIPCGVFITGGIRIRTGVELYLESGAILKGSLNHNDYFGFTEDKIEPVEIKEKPDGVCVSAWRTSRWCNALIRAFDAHDFAVVGEKGSYIDGVNCYDPLGEQKFRGPHGMCFWDCHDIRLEGYTIMHTGNWFHAIFQSQNITVRNLTFFGGHDGIDLRTCDNVLVENCNFNVGDDCVAGFDNNDVVVRNCTMNTGCHAIRFGGNNVVFENCHSSDSGFGHRRSLPDEDKKYGFLTNETSRRNVQAPFNYYCDRRATPRRTVENITVKNSTFTNCCELIRVEFDGLHQWCCNKPLRQVSYENCSIEGLYQTGMVWSNEAERVTFHLKNVHISCREGCETLPLFVAGNFDKIIFEDCVIEGYTDPTVLVGTDGGNVEIINSTPITVKRVSLEECLEAHPHGIIPHPLNV